MEVYGVIYKLTNNLNCKVYVGQTTNLERRIWQHQHGDQYIDKAIQKYGWENFTVEVIAECMSKEELNELEVFFIAYFDCKAPNGYNLTDGGEGLPGEQNPFYGKHHTEETKAILKERQRERVLRGEIPAFLGHHHEEETKVSLSVSHRGDTPYQNLLAEITNRRFTYTALAELMGSSQPVFSLKIRGWRQFSE